VRTSGVVISTVRILAVLLFIVVLLVLTSSIWRWPEVAPSLREEFTMRIYLSVCDPTESTIGKECLVPHLATTAHM
jgi:hypothetical protein